MSTERPDIQCAVRQLASKVTGPDTLDQKELKQLVLYLKHAADYVQEMKKQSFALMASAMGERSDDVKMAATQRPSLLEVFTDSDWASDRTTRRSMSCSHMYLNGIFFWSASRSQKSIALSSRVHFSSQRRGRWNIHKENVGSCAEHESGLGAED